jgi:predicted ATP-dependent serine protease
LQRVCVHFAAPFLGWFRPAVLLELTGEVGIFEMRSTGLEAVTNAAALFAASAAEDSSEAFTDGNGSGRLVGTAIAVIQVMALVCHPVFIWLDHV